SERLLTKQTVDEIPQSQIYSVRLCCFGHSQALFFLQVAWFCHKQG
ncbi:unnamed protein product, partial [Prunus brigantina]